MQSNSDDGDFSKFLDSPTKTRKQRLLEECEKLDVSIYIDDPTEASSGEYANIRGTASEAELDRRLITKKALNQTKRAIVISVISLLVAICALLVSLVRPSHF